MLFNDYSKIIVYGAGKIGIKFLLFLMDKKVDKSKVIVYDKKYETSVDIMGFHVVAPSFESAENNDDTLVVIAMLMKKMSLINELRHRFISAGYKNVDFAQKLMGEVEIIPRSEFSAAYQSAYQDDEDFSSNNPPVKTVAFYLPQFHEIPENDEWWGKGFTEWINTKKAVPQYEGHYQPRMPHKDIGYYDLSDVEAIRKQAELAKKHGIYGWSIYYYWFSGKTLLTKPIDIIYENKDIDINYCLFWCNEKWTKAWVGDEKQTILENEYKESDPVNFINDLKKYMLDDRYIKIDGKPVLIVYKIHSIPDIIDTLEKWRNRAREIGIGEIFIISAINPFTLKDLSLENYFEAETLFGTLWTDYSDVFLTNKYNDLESYDLIYYENIVKHSIYDLIDDNEKKTYLTTICGFDNTARYGNRARIYDVGFTLENWYKQCRFIAEKSIEKNNELMFVFAWNEWAECAYVEPDIKYGYAMINTLSRAICGLPFEY